MLNEQDFALWVKRTRLIRSGSRCCDAHPKLPTGAARGRWPAGMWPGAIRVRKMGVTIQFESHRVELPAM